MLLIEQTMYSMVTFVIISNNNKIEEYDYRQITKSH